MEANMKIDKRLEQNYVEALALMGDLKGIYGKALIVAEVLIDNLSRRLAWQAAENTRRNRAAMAKGEPAPPPIVTVDELETLGRIVAVLQDSKLDTFRTGDPDAGVREIVRVLEEARREFRTNEQKSKETTEGAEETPEDVKEAEDGQGVKTRRDATPEGAVSKTTDGRRRLGIRSN